MIIGHQKQIIQLTDWFNKGQLPTTMIFQGPQNIGKTTVAKYYTKSILEKNINDVYSCTNKQLENWHNEDLMYIDNTDMEASFINLSSFGANIDSKESYAKEISIAKIRKVISFAHLTSINDNWRVVILNSIDNLNYNAANCLLKLLEEPPKKLLIIMISHCASKVLPTIKSRSVVVNFEPLSNLEINNWFNNNYPGINATKRENLLRLSQGALGKLQYFLQNDIEIEYLKFCKSINDTLINSKILLSDLATKTLHIYSKACADEDIDMLWKLIFLFIQRLLSFIHLQASDFTEEEKLLFSKIIIDNNTITKLQEIENLYQNSNHLSLNPKQSLMLAIYTITNISIKK